MREHHSFVEKFLAVAEGRALHIPMSPDHRSEWTLAFGNDEICTDTAALGTGIGHIVDGYIASLLNTGFLNIKRRFLVVLEVPEKIGGLSVRRSQAHV